MNIDAGLFPLSIPMYAHPDTTQHKSYKSKNKSKSKIEQQHKMIIVNTLLPREQKRRRKECRQQQRANFLLVFSMVNHCPKYKQTSTNFHV